jgi:hypothetical protein
MTPRAAVLATEKNRMPRFVTHVFLFATIAGLATAAVAVRLGELASRARRIRGGA